MATRTTRWDPDPVLWPSTGSTCAEAGVLELGSLCLPDTMLLDLPTCSGFSLIFPFFF